MRAKDTVNVMSLIHPPLKMKSTLPLFHLCGTATQINILRIQISVTVVCQSLVSLLQTEYTNLLPTRGLSGPTSQNQRNYSRPLMDTIYSTCSMSWQSTTTFSSDSISEISHWISQLHLQLPDNSECVQYSSSYHLVSSKSTAVCSQSLGYTLQERFCIILNGGTQLLGFEHKFGNKIRTGMNLEDGIAVKQLSR